MENNNPNNIPNEEAVIARRRALAAALQRSEPVIVTPTGSVEIEGEADENDCIIRMKEQIEMVYKSLGGLIGRDKSGEE